MSNELDDQLKAMQLCAGLISEPGRSDIRLLIAMLKRCREQRDDVHDRLKQLDAIKLDDDELLAIARGKNEQM